jgi:hypothetical protein
MQVSLRLENTLQQEFHRFSPAVEASVRQFSQVNARISPGQVWGPLSSLFFEVNYNQVASQSALWEHRSGEPLWRISPPTANDAASEVIGRSGYVKNEFRPDAFWLFTTLAEWGSQEVAASKTRLIRTNWQITEKADVRLALATRITGQYRQSCADAGAGRTTGVIEPSVWLEQRWSEDLLSTMQILYRRTTAHTTLADGLAEDWGGAVDITFRKDRWALMRHVELRQSISANLRISPGIPRQRNVLLTGTTSMDLYPVHALIIRLRCDWNRYRDELISAGGYDTVTGSLKVALQL